MSSAPSGRRKVSAPSQRETWGTRILRELRLALVEEGLCPHCLKRFEKGTESCGACGYEAAPDRAIVPQGEGDYCSLCGAGLVGCRYCDFCWCLNHCSNPLVCPGCGRRGSQ